MIDEGILVFLKDSCAPMTLNVANVPVAFQTEILDIQENNLILVNSIPLRYITSVSQQNHFTLSGGGITVKSSRLESFGCHLKLKIEHMDGWSVKRAYERHLSSGEESWYAFLSHPFMPSIMLKKYVLDVSEGGISLSLRRVSQIFVKDRTFQSIRLSSWPAEQSSRPGRIVYIRPVINLKGEEFYQVGIQFLDPVESI